MPRDRREPAAALGRIGQRLEQVAAYGCCGRAKNSFASATSTIWPAYISATRCAIPATTARSCVISSMRHPLLALQLLQQVEDLRLDRHVERRRRLVGDQEVGLGGERHRDHHALLLSAGQLERIVVDAPLGLGNADALQPLDRLGLAPPRRAAACGARSPRRSGGRPSSPGSGWSPAPGRSCRCGRRARAHPHLGQLQDVVAVEHSPSRRRRGRCRAAGASAPARS